MSCTSYIFFIKNKMTRSFFMIKLSTFRFTFVWHHQDNYIKTDAKKIKKTVTIKKICLKEMTCYHFPTIIDLHNLVAINRFGRGCIKYYPPCFILFGRSCSACINYLHLPTLLHNNAKCQIMELQGAFVNSTAVRFEITGFVLFGTTLML